jgi:hypothetical protein
MRAVLILAFVFMVGSFALDNCTTYVALSEFADLTYEANPVAQAEFSLLGLGPGLFLNFLGGLGVALFITYTKHIGTGWTRVGLLGALGLIRWHAGLHNLTLILLLRGL